MNKKSKNRPKSWWKARLSWQKGAMIGFTIGILGGWVPPTDVDLSLIVYVINVLALTVFGLIIGTVVSLIVKAWKLASKASKTQKNHL